MFGTLQKLYAEGGIPRFYRGLIPALIQVQPASLVPVENSVGINAVLVPPVQLLKHEQVLTIASCSQCKTHFNYHLVTRCSPPSCNSDRQSCRMFSMSSLVVHTNDHELFHVT